MPPLRVTSHAIERYLERIGAESEDAAMAVLSGPAVLAAIEFGARIVRLPRGRIVIEITPVGAKIITVLPVEAGRLPIQLIPPSRGGPPWLAHDPAIPKEP